MKYCNAEWIFHFSSETVDTPHGTFVRCFDDEKEVFARDLEMAEILFLEEELEILRKKYRENKEG